MAIININIDDETKNKLEELAKKRGFNSIQDLLLKNIQKELKEYSIIDSPEIFEVERKPKDEEIANYLRKFSSNLKKISNREKRIKKIVDLDDFLKENKEIIKQKYSDLVVSILNSL